MKPNRRYLSIWMLVAASLILGCANAKPFDYHSGNEIPDGPGLFSKEKGSFTIYSDQEKEQKNPKEEPPTAQTQTASEAVGASSQPSAGDNDEEFRQFKEWKDEQQEFEAFQQWKQAPENAGAYQEFQEWKRWKAYQEWQKAQHKSE